MIWLGRAVIGVVLVCGMAALFFWTATSMQLARLDYRPAPEISAAISPEAIARGERLSYIYGCSGCHGVDLQGDFVWEEPGLATVHAANLTRAMAFYDDAELARAIRDGVRHDDRPLWAMPSESWVEVTDAEMSDLLAFLRIHQPAGPPTPVPVLTLRGRWQLLTGQLRLSPAYVAEARANPALDLGPAQADGRHLAVTVCSECHGSNLNGREGFTPDLSRAATYDLAGFTRLMRTGQALDDRDLGLMAVVSRGRFSHMTDAEVASLHAYLVARAEAIP
ncbi:cytochrome c4 [Brevundimonas aveniformis]|uniref:cytochrome c4 n=1 Tax=Brevundimonas aveniformis TaxID=370977 RepID=UPI0024914FA9|nr:cytochrome c [Brevundimonas aveniformis]